MGDHIQGYNVIAVYNRDATKIIMCKRKKNPYKGMLNLNGGKIEVGEDGLEAAYRELREETGICKEDIRLTMLMSFTYPLDRCYLEVYAGKLNADVDICGDENDLLWVDADSDFFDMRTYAGEGNIGHIVEHIKIKKEVLGIL